MNAQTLTKNGKIIKGTCRLFPEQDKPSITTLVCGNASLNMFTKPVRNHWLLKKRAEDSLIKYVLLYYKVSLQAMNPALCV